jgi:hemerythrin-like domain-containing protein
MATITDALTSEHALFCEMFEEIVRLLPDLRTVPEVRVLSRLVEGVLLRHANVEQNLAFAALDHALAEKGQLARLHQDHQEIDECLHRATVARQLPEAVRLLKAGLAASREHFRREEKSIFPLLQNLFAARDLEALGTHLPQRASSLGTHGFSNSMRGRLRKSAKHNSPKRA